MADGILDQIGRACRNVGRGVASLLETGSWQVEEAADAARSAEVLLDRVDEEVEQHAQETLDHVDDALTYFGKLEGDKERLEGQVATWQKKAQTATTKAKSFEPGSPERVKWEGLAREALKQKGAFGQELAVVTAAYDATKPEADRALQLVEEIGLTKTEALSQRTALQAENASNQAKAKLAAARKTWGSGSGPGQLLAEARQKVSETRARARSGEMIQGAMPASADAVSAEISRAEAASAVDAELAELMK